MGEGISIKIGEGVHPFQNLEDLYPYLKIARPHKATNISCFLDTGNFILSREYYGTQDF